MPSNMNPVGKEGNVFQGLFEKVPAKRAGSAEDIAGIVLYLASKAGVSFCFFLCLALVLLMIDGAVLCGWSIALC